MASLKNNKYSAENNTLLVGIYNPQEGLFFILKLYNKFRKKIQKVIIFLMIFLKKCALNIINIF